MSPGFEIEYREYFFTGHVMTEEDKMLTSMDFEKAAERLIPSVSIQDLISYQQLEKKIKQAT